MGDMGRKGIVVGSVCEEEDKDSLSASFSSFFSIFSCFFTTSAVDPCGLGRAQPAHLLGLLLLLLTLLLFLLSLLHLLGVLLELLLLRLVVYRTISAIPYLTEKQTYPS